MCSLELYQSTDWYGYDARMNAIVFLSVLEFLGPLLLTWFNLNPSMDK